eukprot:GFUD01013499.1.p1 GENE.GFUD01013499.1~~GFUD01013499.1.p1  ORF type:complete len:520 (+),score=121.66 GFUD01013499.1:82-1641(+)
MHTSADTQSVRLPGSVCWVLDCWGCRQGKRERDTAAEMEIEENLFSVIFDYNRGGFRHIGENICKNLDFHSLVSFKRSCKLVYFFLHNCSAEDEILRGKLHKDWLVGEAKTFNLNLALPSAVSNVKIIDDGQNIIVSIGKNIYQYDFENKSEEIGKNEEETLPIFNVSQSITDGLKLKLRLPSSSLNSKINSTFGFDSNGNSKNPVRVYLNENENLEKNQITQFDIIKNFLVAGNNNGILSIWDLDTAELLNSKQLFGIITGVKCRTEEDMIVTSHAGKAFDIGCISVRKMVSPTELSVLWSAYQDVMPVFNFDMNHKYIVTLEWLGTLNMIHVGSASVYSRENSCYTRRDFSDGRPVETRQSATGLINNLANHMNKRFTSAGIFKDDYVALGSDDGPDGHFMLLIWDLTTLTMIHAFKYHMTGIFQIETCGDRLITRDKGGDIVIWDTELAADINYLDTEDNLVLMRKLDLPFKDRVLCIDMDLRRLAVGKIGGAQMFDFWNSAGQGMNKGLGNKPGN